MIALQGWVSIHRKIINNPVWQDPKLLKLWMLCLLEASHKEHEQLVGKQIIKLLPGQFVTGRFSLAKSYNEGAKKSDFVPESTLWRWIKWLENNDFLNIQSNTKFSVISIKNWNLYQQNEQQMNNKWTAYEQQMNTNNNGNKGNNENNKEEDKHVNRILEILEKSEILGEKGITEFLRDDITDIIDRFGFEQPEEMIIEAIKESARGNGKTWLYVYKKLVDWKNKNYITPKDLEKEDQDAKKVSQHRRGNGRPAKEKQESIFGDKIGRY